MIDNIRVLTLGQIRKAIVQLLGKKICVNTHDGRIEKKKKKIQVCLILTTECELHLIG